MGGEVAVAVAVFGGGGHCCCVWSSWRWSWVLSPDRAHVSRDGSEWEARVEVAAREAR